MDQDSQAAVEDSVPGELEIIDASTGYAGGRIARPLTTEITVVGLREALLSRSRERDDRLTRFAAILIDLCAMSLGFDQPLRLEPDIVVDRPGRTARIGFAASDGSIVAGALVVLPYRTDAAATVSLYCESSWPAPDSWKEGRRLRVYAPVIVEVDYLAGDVGLIMETLSFVGAAAASGVIGDLAVRGLRKALVLPWNTGRRRRETVLGLFAREMTRQRLRELRVSTRELRFGRDEVTADGHGGHRVAVEVLSPEGIEGASVHIPIETSDAPAQVIVYRTESVKEKADGG